MDPESYKNYHENYMKNNNGTSSAECLTLLLSIPLCLFIYSLVSKYFPKKFLPILEFSLIILPVVLNVTIFSELNFVIFLHEMLTFITIFAKNLNLDRANKLLNSEITKTKHFVTAYRAGTNFFSAICILAVDFTVFPKRLAKTETYGFGFMDLGVGCFVCSHGLVSKHVSEQYSLTKVIKPILVLFSLGFIRLVSVKLLDYHENVNEYGVHWNFFFTLAFCHLLSQLLFRLTNYTNPLWLAIATGLFHETVLFLGLKDWVLSDIPRDSLLTSNREGLTSCLGFVTLYLAACGLGNFIMHSRKMTYKEILIKLIITCFFLWESTLIFATISGVSRRLANLGYILWVLTATVALIIFCIAVELSISLIQNKNHIPDWVPFLLKSINKNGLFFFLFSNLLTGIINVCAQTLLLGEIESLIIIISYMITLCSVTNFLYVKSIFLKV